jgi:hypothetical protein
LTFTEQGGIRMHDQRERFWTSPTGTPHSTRWVAWMPLLFVAAFLYWSVALGLGGLSLMAASAISGDLQEGQLEMEGPGAAPSVMEPAPGHASIEPIVIHLEESAEPEDVNDNVGAVMPSDQADSQADAQGDIDDGTGRLPGQTVRRRN